MPWFGWLGLMLVVVMFIVLFYEVLFSPKFWALPKVDQGGEVSMPCFDNWTTDESARHNSEVAQMLCAVMPVLERHSLLDDPGIPESVRVWWREHKARDAIRFGRQP